MPARPCPPVLDAALSAALGAGRRIDAVSPASGGCIHTSFVVESEGVRLFVKTNAAGLAEAFAAESDGLEALSVSGMRAPRPLAHGIGAGRAYLAMEYLDLGRDGDWAEMGRALARMHRKPPHETHGERYGWKRDNFIGATPQRNRGSGDWAAFWAEERLGPQLALAGRNGSARFTRAGRRLVEALPRLLAGYTPEPSLLHGDLWNGNAGFLADGTPVLFDPAVYVGDREADLAMTELFGGFPPSFYAAYSKAWPLDPGYELRRDIYNLYHVLNHANLFGGGYAAQGEALIGRLLSEAR
jgi:protein-ribulosamine 3-kinase